MNDYLAASVLLLYLFHYVIENELNSETQRIHYGYGKVTEANLRKLNESCLRIEVYGHCLYNDSWSLIDLRQLYSSKYEVTHRPDRSEVAFHS